MTKHICQSCGGPLSDYKKDELINPDFCPYCVDEKGKLKNYSDILQGMIDYLKSDHPEVNELNRPTAAEKMLEDESPIWGQTFSGCILKESLNKVDVYNYVTVTDEAKGNISFKRTKLAKVLEHLLKDLKKGWWADVSYKDEVNIVFNGKLFSGSKKDSTFMKDVNDYATSVGVPETELPF